MLNPLLTHHRQVDGNPFGGVRRPSIPATSMKMLILFLLMMSILAASHYGASVPAVLRQPTD
jgi:hypothetical protein